MRLLSSWLGGIAATAVMILLLAALTPSGRPPSARSGPADRSRVLLRAEAPRAVERERTRARADAGTPGGGATGRSGAAGGGGPGKAARGAGGAGPRRGQVTARPLAPTGAALAREWPADFAWPGDGLASIPMSIGGFSGGDDGGAGGGTGGGSGSGSGSGTGSGGAGSGPGSGGREAPARRPPGLTRRAIAQYAPQPGYPSGARTREQSGFVEAVIRIDAQGRVSSVDITSGAPEFAEAVRGTVSRWRFDPAMRDGVSQPSAIRRRFEFRMVDR